MSSTYCKDPDHGWFDPECPYCRIEELVAERDRLKGKYDALKEAVSEYLDASYAILDE